MISNISSFRPFETSPFTLEKAIESKNDQRISLNETVVRTFFNKYYVYNFVTDQWRPIKIQNNVVEIHFYEDVSISIIKVDAVSERIVNGTIFVNRYYLDVRSLSDQIMISRSNLWIAKNESIFRSIIYPINSSDIDWIPQNFICDRCCIRKGVFPPLSGSLYQKSRCYRVLNRRLFVHLYGYSTIIAYDLKATSIENSVVHIEFCANHRPCKRMQDIGSNNDIIYFFNVNKDFCNMHITSELSEIYTLDMRTLQRGKLSVDVSNVSIGTVIEPENLQKTLDTVYSLDCPGLYPCFIGGEESEDDEEMKEQLSNPHIFVSLSLTSLKWYEHRFVFTEPLRWYYVNEYGELIVTLGRTKEDIRQFKWKHSIKTTSLHNLAAQAVFKGVFKNIDNFDQLKKELPKSILDNYL